MWTLQVMLQIKFDTTLCILKNLLISTSTVSTSCGTFKMNPSLWKSFLGLRPHQNCAGKRSEARLGRFHSNETHFPGRKGFPKLSSDRPVAFHRLEVFLRRLGAPRPVSERKISEDFQWWNRRWVGCSKCKLMADCSHCIRPSLFARADMCVFFYITAPRPNPEAHSKYFTTSNTNIGNGSR